MFMLVRTDTYTSDLLALSDHMSTTGLPKRDGIEESHERDVP